MESFFRILSSIIIYIHRLTRQKCNATFCACVAKCIASKWNAEKITQFLVHVLQNASPINSWTIFPQQKGPFYSPNNFSCMTKIPIRDKLIETVKTVDHSSCKIAEQMKVKCKWAQQGKGQDEIKDGGSSTDLLINLRIALNRLFYFTGNAGPMFIQTQLIEINL